MMKLMDLLQVIDTNEIICLMDINNRRKSVGSAEDFAFASHPLDIDQDDIEIKRIDPTGYTNAAGISYMLVEVINIKDAAVTEEELPFK